MLALVRQDRHTVQASGEKGNRLAAQEPGKTGAGDSILTFAAFIAGHASRRRAGRSASDDQRRLFGFA